MKNTLLALLIATSPFLIQVSSAAETPPPATGRAPAAATAAKEAAARDAAAKEPAARNATAKEEAAARKAAAKAEAAKAEAAKEATASDEITFGPYFIGFETEPAMEAGGRLVTSVDTLIGDAGWKVTKRIHGLSAAYELFFGLGLSIVQHEVFGHGSRAREYNLDPQYGFGLDFSGYTEINKDPKDNRQMANLCSGGTEGDSILGHRLLVDYCQPGGAPACTFPLMLFTKTDVSLYVLSTSKPEPADEDASTSFVDDYESGNDIAIYLASRQAQRLGGKAVDVWNRDYKIDFDEGELKTSWDDARAAATWNLIDPMMFGSLFLYVVQHEIQGKRVMSAPAIPFGHGYGFTAGTRA
jgi:hypothetical protein